MTKPHKCSVDGCNWYGYIDTGKCWAHSQGKEPENQPRADVHYAQRRFINTFAEVCAAEGIDDGEPQFGDEAA